MNCLIKPLPATLLALLVHGYAVAGSIKVPVGFEELAKGQVLWLDVVAYGHSLGLYQARVDLENVQFIKPTALVAAIREQYHIPLEQSPLIDTALASALKRNSHLTCSSNGKAPGCDFLETDGIALIYDENNSSVKLFFDSAIHPRKTESDHYHQVTAKSRNALVHQQNINFIADDTYQSASVQANGALGVTQNSFLNLDWNWQGQQYRSERRQDIDVSNAYYRYDLLKRYYAQVGIMDARDIFSNVGGNINLSQLPLDRIRGVRAGSTLAWLNQETVSRGTPLILLLSQEARVDAYRDNQLLASFYLNAGSHELNTSNFPAGSYNVTLRIFENNQLARAQTLPFTNLGTAQLATPQWFVQTGKLDLANYNSNTSNSDSNDWVFQGGLRLPLVHNLSLTTGSTSLSDVQFYESAVDWNHGFSTGPIDGVMTTRASYLYGSDGSRGNIQQLSYNDGFSLSFFRTEKNSPDCDSMVQKRYSYSGCYTSTSAMLSVPVSSWFTNLSYTRNTNSGRFLSRNQLPDLDPELEAGAPWDQIFTSHSRTRTLQAGLSRTFRTGGINISTSINAFTRNSTGYHREDRGGFLTISASRVGNRNAAGSRQSSTLGASWQTSRQQSDQLGYNASYSHYSTEGNDREIGASFSGVNTDNVMVSAWGRGSGQYGSGSLNLSNAWVNENNRNTFTAGGNYNSSLLVDRAGITLGRWGNGLPSSAITVALATEEENNSSRIDMSLDTGISTGIGATGRAMLPITGYRPATLSIKESLTNPYAASSEMGKGSGSQPLFMPPGRVVLHDVEVASRYSWLGKLTDEQQRPLEHAIALNAVSWTALNNGGFLMETSAPVKMLYAMKDDRFWQCPLEVKTVRDIVRYVGVIQCSSMPLTQLPDAEQKQAVALAGNFQEHVYDDENSSREIGNEKTQ